MSIPSQAGKVSLEQLQGISQISWDGRAPLPKDKQVILSFEEGGHRFDFLWNPKPGAERIFVFFSGDAIRAKNDPPVFQRWSWAKHFPGHCLYISDPSLYLEDGLGLAWYAGTENFDPLLVIRERLTAILHQLGLVQTDLVSYGSSGGGFASLRLLTMMPEITAVAINPQTCITEYEFKNVERYLRVCFGRRSRTEALAEFPDRLSLIESAAALKGRKAILVQNVLDTHHYERHYKPLCAALGVSDDHAPDNPGLHRILFSNEGGHGKAEDPETFKLILKLICEGN